MELDKAPAAPPDIDDEDLEDESAPAEEIPQVSSYIAIIRIVAVLGMGLCVPFRLSIMFVGTKRVLIGITNILLSSLCYYGMQLAERLATNEHNKRQGKQAHGP